MIEHRINAKDKHHSSLGKEIKISPKSHVYVCEPGLEIKYESESVHLLIGIGKDHVANLIMSLDAWNALKGGDEIKIDTLKEFKSIFVK